MKVKEAAASYLADKVFTYHDYINLPEDGKRYEVIEGELVTVAAPSVLHQRVSRNILFALLKFIEEKKLGQVLFTPVDVILSDSNIVQPDIIFISQASQKIITEKNIQGAPDLVVEIISPFSAYYDLIEKREIYQKSGVHEYWLVDPKRLWVEIYQNVNQQFERVQRADQEGTVYSRVLPGFALSLAAIFAE